MPLNLTSGIKVALNSTYLDGSSVGSIVRSATQLLIHPNYTGVTATTAFVSQIKQRMIFFKNFLHRAQLITFNGSLLEHVASGQRHCADLPQLVSDNLDAVEDSLLEIGVRWSQRSHCRMGSN